MPRRQRQSDAACCAERGFVRTSSCPDRESTNLAPTALRAGFCGGFSDQKVAVAGWHLESRPVMSQSNPTHVCGRAASAHRSQPTALHTTTRNLHTLPRSGRDARWTNTPAVYKVRTPNATPQPDHVTSKRTSCRLRSHDRPPPSWNVRYSATEGIPNTVTVYETAALMRGRLGRLGRLRATAILSAPPPAQPVHHLGGRLRFGLV